MKPELILDQEINVQPHESVQRVSDCFPRIRRYISRIMIVFAASSCLHAAPNTYQNSELKANGRGLTCKQIAKCAEQCGKRCPSGLSKFTCLLKCAGDCKRKGRTSAQKLFEKLTGCVQKRCLSECIGGPSAKCTQCTTARCAKETNACNK